MERIKQLEDIIMTLEIDFMRFRELEQMAPGVRARKGTLEALKVLNDLDQEVAALKGIRDAMPENKYKVLPVETSLLATVVIAIGDS